MGPSYFCDEPKASLQKLMGPFIKEQHVFAQCFFGTTIRFRVASGEINNSVQHEKQGWFNPSAKNNEKSTRSAQKLCFKDKACRARDFSSLPFLFLFFFWSFSPRFSFLVSCPFLFSFLPFFFHSAFLFQWPDYYFFCFIFCFASCFFLLVISFHEKKKNGQIGQQPDFS